MMTPIFIPISSGGGSMTPFQHYQMISCAILFFIGVEVTDAYGFSIILALLAFLICYFLGWLLLPILALAFLILFINSLIRKE